MKKISMTAITVLATAAVAACGGGATPTRSGAPASGGAPASVSGTLPPASIAAPSVAAPSGPEGGITTPEGLCGLLNATDWQQFNYVTTAQPEVSSDGEGTAICSWGTGLELEIYTHASASEAEATYETVIENVPMDDPQAYYVPRSAQSVFDSDIGDGSAGMVAQAGRLVVFVSGLSRESAQAELATLAGLVVARGSSLI